MKKLKNRLYTVLTLVPLGARVADIGTDHGHLPISLIKAGVSPLVIASDINERPLLSAKINVEKTSTENIELRLGDGLSTIKHSEVDCIVVAGMGGEVISSILENCSWIKDERYTLILQPMTSADALRRYLYNNGFEIKSEVAVEDSGKLYTVIKAAFCGNYTSKSEAFYRVGRLNPDNPIDRRYIQKQFKIARKCVEDLEKTNNDASLYKEICSELKLILGEK